MGLADMVQGMFWFAIEITSLMTSAPLILLMYWFQQEYQVETLYGIQAKDLLFFVYFSLLIIPFQMNIDIFLHNFLELMHGWKLHDYIAFCNERFSKRTRRWMGNDTELNEALQADLRPLDHMCMSDQFFFMTSLHALGIMFTVLGYMLTQIAAEGGHNIFQDPGSPALIMILKVLSKFYVKFMLRLADKYKIWWVEGEADAEDEYDEGPGFRGAGDLPEGMAAVDEEVAVALEEAYNAGYSIEQLTKILEDLAYIPPSVASVSAAGAGVADPGQGGLALAGLPGFGVGGPLGSAGGPLGGGGGAQGKGALAPLPASLLAGPQRGTPEVEQGFEDFMEAFRKDVEDKQSDQKRGRFVPQMRDTEAERLLAMKQQAPGFKSKSSGESGDGQGTRGAAADMDIPYELQLMGEGEEEDEGEEEETGYDEWPDELMTGIAEIDGEEFAYDDQYEADDAEYDDLDDDDEGDSDEWPDELMIG